jgi:hypothetical protein
MVMQAFIDKKKKKETILSGCVRSMLHLHSTLMLHVQGGHIILNDVLRRAYADLVILSTDHELIPAGCERP